MLASGLIWSARLIFLLLMVVSLLPLLPSGEWWVRIWEFPRVQLTVLLILPTLFAAAHAWKAGRRTEHAILLVATLILAGWHVSHVLPYTPVWPVRVPNATDKNTQTLRLLTANIEYKNNRRAEMLAMIEAQDPDVLLLLEVDEAWDQALGPALDERYRHRIGVVRGEGLGIVLWSRFPLSQQNVRHLVSRRRASVFVTLALPNGFGELRYVGVHPTPPGLTDRIEQNEFRTERRDSRVRDAELVLVAEQIRRDPDSRWIVTGDFNDVAWSPTTQLFQDLSGLKDPRVGRQLLNTYHAQRPFLRYPIDHVFVSDGLHLISMKRVRAPGSDHFAVVAELALVQKQQRSPEVSADEVEKAKDIVRGGVSDAVERDVPAKNLPDKVP